MAPSLKFLLAQSLLVASGARAAITVDVNDQASIKAAAAQVAKDLMTFYHGDEPGQIPGILSGPPPEGDSYWYEGGLLWTAMLDYRNKTGDTKYDETIVRGLEFQVGAKNDFLPANWTISAGNDDQLIWGLASLQAEKTSFRGPSGNETRWNQWSKNVFSELSDRAATSVNNGTCKGALRWQISIVNNGYNYISTFANAGYFAMGAELAFLNKNDTAADEAKKVYEVLSKIGLVNDKFNVYEGVSVLSCDDEDRNRLQFSGSPAMLIQGSAYLFNHEANNGIATNGNETWKKRLDGLLNSSLEMFWKDGAAFEIACEAGNKCNNDMYYYKGMLHRALATAMQYAPYTAEMILPKLKTSAKAAVSTCTGGNDGTMCGFEWSKGKFDGKAAPAKQMSVLNALLSITDSPSSGGKQGGDKKKDEGSSSPEKAGAGGNAGAVFGTSTGLLLGGLVLSAMNLV